MRAVTTGLVPFVCALGACTGSRAEADVAVDSALQSDLQQAALAVDDGGEDAPGTSRRTRETPTPRAERRSSSSRRPAASERAAAPERGESRARTRGEPSASDMRAALQRLVDNYNENMLGTREACEAREFENDPVLAMQCLALLGASGGDRRIDFTAEITRFQKIGCEKAVGRPGYVCDYVVGMSQNNPAMNGVLGDMARAGEVVQGRFVQTDGGWLKMPDP